MRVTEAQAKILLDRARGFKRGSIIRQEPKKRAKGRKRQRSELEMLLAEQMALLNLPNPVTEHKGVPGRDFRIDFAWPDKMVAVECQGMVHRIKGRFKADTEKHCLLVLAGWKLLPVCGDDIRSGRAVGWIEKLLCDQS